MDNNHEGLAGIGTNEAAQTGEPESGQDLEKAVGCLARAVAAQQQTIGQLASALNASSSEDRRARIDQSLPAFYEAELFAVRARMAFGRELPDLEHTTEPEG